MLRTIIFLLGTILFFSCNNRKDEAVNKTIQKENAISDNKDPFFPVTDYIKGQISDIQKGGVNPIKYVTINNLTDSSWLKMEDLAKEVRPFLEIVIDTSNLTHLFSEKKFLDQTIGAYTFTYDPLDQLPDTFLLKHWDVYIDPATSKVKRIYMVKKTNDNKIVQLTWQSDKWCKIVTIAPDKSGKTSVEKDILIKWDF